MVFTAYRFAGRRFAHGRAMRTACIATFMILCVGHRGRRRTRRLPLPAAPAASVQLPAPPANGEMGFVFSTSWSPSIPASGACPNGLANMVRDNFLSNLPPAERARLLKPENEPELTKDWKAYGFSPDHRMNVCGNYDQFDHPLYKTVQSKIAYGVNLDGDTSGEARATPTSARTRSSPAQPARRVSTTSTTGRWAANAIWWPLMAASVPIWPDR